MRNIHQEKLLSWWEFVMADFSSTKGIHSLQLIEFLSRHLVPPLNEVGTYSAIIGYGNR